mgnify:CR=1 FL=1
MAGNKNRLLSEIFGNIIPCFYARSRNHLEIRVSGFKASLPARRGSWRPRTAAPDQRRHPTCRKGDLIALVGQTCSVSGTSRPRRRHWGLPLPRDISETPDRHRHRPVAPGVSPRIIPLTCTLQSDSELKISLFCLVIHRTITISISLTFEDIVTIRKRSFNQLYLI